MFFAHGQELAVDPGRAKSQAYRLPIHRQWYKASLGHNVVLVDGKGQGEADGKLISFAANDSYAGVVAEAGPAFDAVTHRRMLILTPSYLLVVDELEAADGKEHDFQWVYHNRGKSVECALPVAEATLPKTPGMEYLQDIRAMRTDKARSNRVSFAGEGVTTHGTVAAEEGDTIFTATGPFRSVDDRVPLVIVCRRGRTATFVTAIEPVTGSRKASISAVEGPSTSTLGLGVNVTHGRTDDTVVFDPGLKKGVFRVFTGEAGSPLVESVLDSRR
jgi:hypothetical protein